MVGLNLLSELIPSLPCIEVKGDRLHQQGKHILFPGFVGFCRMKAYVYKIQGEHVLPLNAAFAIMLRA